MWKFALGFLLGTGAVAFAAALSFVTHPNGLGADAFQFKVYKSAPGVCDASHLLGVVYYDSDSGLCECKGASGWVAVSDFSTGCT